MAVLYMNDYKTTGYPLGKTKKKKEKSRHIAHTHPKELNMDQKLKCEIQKHSLLEDNTRKGQGDVRFDNDILLNVKGIIHETDNV